MSDCLGLEAFWPLVLAQKYPCREPDTRRCREIAEHSGLTRQGHRGVKGHTKGDPVTGHGVDTGTRYGAQRRKVEAGGCWVLVMFRWTELYDGR